MYIKMNLIWDPIIVGINNKAQIVGLWFEEQKYFPTITNEALIITIGDAKSEDLSEAYVENHELNTVIHKIVKQLREYEEGKRKVFELPLAPEGTDFRNLVWDILNEIPYGKTTTYGEIGHEVAEIMNKKRMSAQAVGGAVGHNPIGIIIPCHRVIGSDGGLTGYAGGILKKEKLLSHEARYNMYLE